MTTTRTHINNPAMAEGWVKSQDTKSGRFFYANHVTRKTQWNPPPNWHEEQDTNNHQREQQENVNHDDADHDDNKSTTALLLPSNWEICHDPSTGKPFYVDHDRKITTWTRPTLLPVGGTTTKTTTNNTTNNSSTTSRSNAFQRILSSSSSAQQQQQQQKTSPFMTRASSSRHEQLQQQHDYHHHQYQYHHPTSSSSSSDYNYHYYSDFSDALPMLNFKVKKVPDSYRNECPHCHALFTTLSKRRHHCRLCGDLFCDACSSQRAELPLEGSEFDHAVRICDYCWIDVQKQNFFTMRRYLTPLILYNNNNNNNSNNNTTTSKKNDEENDDDEEEEVNGLTSASHISAALCALTTDLESWLQNSTNVQEKMTIPAKILVPAILQHVQPQRNNNNNNNMMTTTTSAYAIRALASLLALGSIMGDPSFAHAVYQQQQQQQHGGQQDALDSICKILEQSGSDRKTLYVQEQAARAMFYLSDSSILTTTTLSDAGNEHCCLDMERSIRSMLDHSSMSKNPALQRWAAACIRKLVMEDERRACMACNETAATIASGEQDEASTTTTTTTGVYKSFLDQLVSTGGIMILCSLVGTDDTDTRTHAIGALMAILQSTRAIDASLLALSEMTGSSKPRPKDGDIIRAIVSGGGCGSSISQLLLSADHSVATMGCEFLASIVMDVLADPRGSATLATNYNCEYDNDGLGACREAALAICTGSCLPALLSLARDAELGSRITRPMKLRQRAMETLAAVVMAVGQMARATDSDRGGSGSSSGGSGRLKEAIAALNTEEVVTVAFAIMESSSSQSLLSSQDNPAMRIRETAGIILSSMTECSSGALDNLQAKGVLSSLLAAASDSDMWNPSTLRGDAAPRCLGVLQTASTILMHAWTHDDATSSSTLLDRLLEAIDAGAISITSRVLFTKMDWESQDKSAGAMKAREACCGILCAMFGIARNDDTGMGPVRLYNAVDAAAYSGSPPRNVTTATLSTLQTSASYARRALMGGGIQAPHYHAALMDLVEAALLATGSMCGSAMAPGDADFDNMESGPTDDDYKSKRQDACNVACDILVHRGRQGPLLPTMLVGGFGEGTVNASLRLALAIAQHGSNEQHAKLAMSGILVPIADSLRNALSTGDLYKFSASLALVRFCGPHVAAGQGGGLQAVQDAIRVATNVLTLPVDPNADIGQVEVQESLKAECITTLEALSKNASLWSAISKDALPSIVSYLHGACESGLASSCGRDTRVAALRAVLRIVQLPSHAVAAAQAGLVEPLAKLMKEASDRTMTDGISLLALEIMHVLVSNAEARRHARLLQSGVFQSVCRALGNAATNKAEKPTDSRADIAFWGLEILHFILLDVESAGDFATVLQSPAVNDIVDTVSLETKFMQALCATLLLPTGMKLPCNVEDDESDGYEIPLLYGPPLVLVNESCAGFPDTHRAALSLLFSVAVYACAIETASSESVWKTLLAVREGEDEDSEDRSRLCASFCAEFLSLLDDDNTRLFSASNGRKRNEIDSISRPLVRHRLLESLKSCLEQQSSVSFVPGMSNSDPYLRSLLVGYNVPQICLSAWRDPALVDITYMLLKLMVDEYNEDVLPLFVQSKVSTLSLFDMLTVDESLESVDVNFDEFRRLVVSILGSLAQEGMLARAVDQFDVRSSATAALAAAALAEDEATPDDDEDAPATSSRMSSKCMECLVELCSVETGDIVVHRKMTLSQTEANAITQSLGKKICQMVTSRFLERAKLQQYNVHSDDDIMDAPDVAMLCAVAQHESALQILRSIGGLHALCLIASEGDASALTALHQASIEDPSLLLDVDGHVSIVHLFSDESKASRSEEPVLNRQVETAAFGILSELCSQSKGRSAVTESKEFGECLEYAGQLVRAMTSSQVEVSDVAETLDDTEQTKPEEDVEQEPVASDTVAAPPPYSTIQATADTSLETAAVKFLTSVVPSQMCRSTILQNDNEFVRAAMQVTKESPCLELHSEVIRFLVKISPYIKKQDEGVSLSVAEKMMAVFLDVLQIETARTGRKALPNAAIVQNAAMEGVEILFESVSPELQRSVVSIVVERFARLVKTFTRPSGKDATGSRTHGGVLACSLTLLMLSSIGKTEVNDLLRTKDLLTFMIQLTQWRYDPKSRSEDSDTLYWDTAVCHCLQLMAFVFRGTEECLEEADIVPGALARTVLMMARPGKAPRKAIDFPSALRRIVQDGTNMAAVVAAQRILSLLEEN